jgi:flagellin-specific chaperone FliS
MTNIKTTGKQGGKRSNCGRKAIADKKIQLYVFIKQSVIDANGGKDEAKIKMVNSLLNSYPLN